MKTHQTNKIRFALTWGKNHTVCICEPDDDGVVRYHRNCQRKDEDKYIDALDALTCLECEAEHGHECFILWCMDGNYQICPTKESIPEKLKGFIFDEWHRELTSDEENEIERLTFHLLADGYYDLEGDPGLRLMRVSSIPDLVSKYTAMEEELLMRRDGTWPMEDK